MAAPSSKPAEKKFWNWTAAPYSKSAEKNSRSDSSTLFHIRWKKSRLDSSALLHICWKKNPDWTAAPSSMVVKKFRIGQQRPLKNLLKKKSRFDRRVLFWICRKKNSGLNSNNLFPICRKKNLRDWSTEGKIGHIIASSWKREGLQDFMDHLGIIIDSMIQGDKAKCAPL